MLDDARTLETGARLEADVCVIGGGAAGLVVAQGLAGPGRSVVVLESGGAQREAGTEAPADALLAGRARGQLLGRGNRYLRASRVRGFGGQLTRWHRECRALDDTDFAARAWVAGSGWPLAPADLADHYRRARELAVLGATGAAPKPLAADARFDPSWLDYSPTPALGAAWRLEVARGAGIRVWTHATVTALALDKAGTRVGHAVVRCLDGPRFTVRARHFVLAAGALENARLLLASNDRRGAGLGNSRDLVGRYFMEQPMLRPGVVFLAARGQRLARFEPPGAAPGRRLILRPTRATRERHELLNSLAWIEPATADAAGSLGPAIARLVASQGTAAGAAVEPGLFGALTLRGEQRPRPDSRLVLGRERDALGVPQIDLVWTLDRHDSWSLRTTARLLGESLGRWRLGRLQLRVGDRLRRRFYGWSGHQCGTTRMSREPATGVVDPDCRLHEVPNVHVAGSSVFPTSGCSGPVLTILALGLRLAERLSRELDA